MRDVYRTLLTTLTGLLALWLILGFWPLSVGSKVVLCLLVILVCGIVLWRQWIVSPRPQDIAGDIMDESLPPEDFQGAVILACGDSAGLFESGAQYRETRQGWYLWVKDAEQLTVWVKHLSLVRPALVSQVSVLLAVVPEYHHSADDFTQRLRSWQRALVQCRPWLGGLPPVWTVTWISPPGVCSQETPVWFSAVSQRTGIFVHQPGEGHLSLTDWAGQHEASGRISRLSQALWLDSLLGWQAKNVASLLDEQQGELPALRPCVQGFCMVPINGQHGNLWQQHIASITALPPDNRLSAAPFPLPEKLLSALPRRRGISRQMVFWRYAGLSGGIFLMLAMLASFTNNQNLIRNVDDHLALYHRLTGEPPEPKLQAQQRLRLDSNQLDDWQRQGEPLRYRMALYQGLRLVAPVEAALHGWAMPAPPTPTPPAPVIQNTVPSPKTVHLDGMSLFDPGKSALKPGSDKVLINSLVGIKGRPGGLIVISGHTDNTGNNALNQKLSLARAEAVRDWISDTGDIPDSCFAVQGFGDSRPVASNDTPEGRARNRRVEIRLVPQADACQVPDTTSASLQDDDANAY